MLPHGDERRRAHLSVAAAARDAVRDCGIGAKVAHSVDAVDAAYGAADAVAVKSKHTHDHHRCGTRGLPLRCSAAAVADGQWPPRDGDRTADGDDRVANGDDRVALGGDGAARRWMALWPSRDANFLPRSARVGSAAEWTAG